MVENFFDFCERFCASKTTILCNNNYQNKNRTYVLDYCVYMLYSKNRIYVPTADQEGGFYMETEEIRKYLREIIEKLNNEQLRKLYQLIRGIFGKVI